MPDIRTNFLYLGPDHSLKSLEYLDLDLRLDDIMLTPRATGDLVCLDQLGTDGLGAEVFERVGFNCIDAQLGVGLDDSEATGDWNGLITVRYIGICPQTETYGRSSCYRRPPR